MDSDLVFCKDVNGVLEALGHYHDPNEWRLFIDSSKLSLKAVLIHNGNILPSVPLRHAVHMKETYGNMDFLLKQVNYEVHNWKICGGLKVLGMLLDMQQGYTKYCCFICEWDSRARDKHYKVKQWPLRQELTPGNKNVTNPPLVDSRNVFLPPLHIKVGLMKIFVKAMDKNGDGFEYLKNKFTRISEAKIKEGIFVGPQIRQLLKDNNFVDKLNEKEKSAFLAFKAVCENFLGNFKAENYVELVNNMLSAYESLGVNMSLKIHFLDSHLEFFPENLGAVSDEHGERFHQDIACMEKRYQGQWNPNMLADYCWFLKNESNHNLYKRKSYRNTF